MNLKINSKFLFILASVIIMLFFISTFSLATEEYYVSVALASNSSLKENQIVNVNVNLSDINAGNGIDVVTGRLIYDTNLFEPITENDFNSNTGWHITYGPSTNMLVAIKSNKVTQKETIFTISLKAKSTINLDATTISLQDIVVSGGSIVYGGTDDIYVNNAFLTIKKPVQEVVSTPSADYSVSMSLTHNTPFEEGENINISANVVDINAGNGIDVVTAKLVYDTNLFEPIIESDFSSNTGWSITYGPSTNMLVAVKNNKITQKETIFTISFKAKSIINHDSTTISLQDIVVSGGSIVYGGTDDIYVNDANLTLTKTIDVVSNTSNVVDTTENIDITVKNENKIAIPETVEKVDASNVKDSIALDSNINISTTADDMLVSAVDDLDTNKNITVSNISKNISENKDDGSKLIEHTVIGSASSISFISLIYVLFRKLLCGI